MREKVVSYLYERSDNATLMKNECASTLLAELKEAVKYCEPQEFDMLMKLVDKTSIPK